jgi:prohibitin 2
MRKTAHKRRNWGMTKARWITISGLVLVLAILAAGSVTKVEYGHVGMRKTFGKLSEEILQPGVHMKWPFIQSVVEVNVQVAKAEADTSASSKDMQPVKTHLVVNHRVDEKSAYKLLMNVGENYETKIIAPAIQEVLKEVTAKYSADELISRRDNVASEVQDGLTKRLARYDLLVQDISIVNFEFSKTFTESIEAKQAAVQQALRAENDLKRVEIEAKQKIEQAKAEAESLRLKKQEVTPELVRLKEIEVQEKALEKWDGKLPQVTGGATPFIDLSKMSSGNETK